MDVTADTTMSAIAVAGGRGPAEALVLIDMPIPRAGSDELLIKVHAAGVNRPDIFQRLGLYPPAPDAPTTLGLEVSGEVVTAAGRWKVGDRVCALLSGGGYAQFAACDPRHALPIPKGLNFVEAACLPEAVLTVYANVFDHTGLRPGQTFLIHGATSGIGVTAIQMAKAAEATVIATARGAAKAEIARQLGADLAIDTSEGEFADAVLAAGGADIVLDMVGGSYFAQNLACLKPKGRIVFIASLGGAEITVPVFELMRKQAVLTGSTLRARDADEKARLCKAVEDVVWPWVTDGSVKVLIDKTFPLADAAAAHARMEAGSHVGKIVLLPTQGSQAFS